MFSIGPGTKGWMLLACLLGVLGCQQPHVEMKVAWEGSTAEDLAEYVNIHFPEMELAVIKDGKGTVYFQQPLTEVEAAIAREAPTARSGMVFSCEEMTTPIPPLPEVHMKESLHFQLKEEVRAKYGLSIIDVIDAIRAIPEEELPKVWRKVKISDHDGGLISLEEVVDASTIQSPRPLIIDRRE
ncbi:hypothetical protein AB1L30_24585 [Bremerella sp. JC817]|uniref:hypothetical protein n=1 Tax=Bremerella sp. JC817 TaxID=3231756 RepID=UPI0034580B71